MTIVTEPRHAWQCAGCGRVSNASHKPQHHWRHGEQCGPFVPATVAADGQVLAPAGATIIPAAAHDTRPEYRYRVTTLRSFACECPRSTLLSSPHDTGGIDTSGDRGSLMHAAIAEILRTLWRQSEPQFERTEDAIVILREVAAAGPWIITPADMFGARNPDGTIAQSGLVQMIGSFAQQQWPIGRIVVIEGAGQPFTQPGRMTREIACPDGEIRTLSGAPDLVIASPPDTMIVIDHKQGMGRPVEPRDPPPEGQPIRGVQYLSDPQGDYFQLCAYAALVMAAYPAVKTVIGREKNWRWLGPWREVTINRETVDEHVIPYLATVMMQLDRARREGEGSEFAQPRAGKQCATRCSVKMSCPIPAEERGVGLIDSLEAADALAQRWRVLKAVEPAARKALKTHHEQTGHCPDAGSGEVVRWDGEKPNRKFGFHAPPRPPSPEEIAEQEAADEAFVALMEAELARQRERAGVAG